MKQTFYCTDKGRHKRRDIGTIQDGEQVNQDRQWAIGFTAKLGFPGQSFGPDMPNRLVERRSQKLHRYDTGKVIQKKFDALTSQETKKGRVWTFKCPTCDRAPRVTDQQLRQLYDMAADQPETVLDISNWLQ
jgi:hypothetical protein